MYDTYVRRQAIEAIRSERAEHIRAILSNGGYFQSDKAMAARKDEIERLNEHFDNALDAIMDPGKAAREAEELANNPLFAAGSRGLERLKWDLHSKQVAAAQLKAQGL